MGKLTLKVLGFQEGAALSEFDQIVIQDGSSFAIHDALRQVFPGRFSACIAPWMCSTMLLSPSS